MSVLSGHVRGTWALLLSLSVRVGIRIRILIGMGILLGLEFVSVLMFDIGAGTFTDVGIGMLRGTVSTMRGAAVLPPFSQTAAGSPAPVRATLPERWQRSPRDGALIGSLEANVFGKRMSDGVVVLHLGHLQQLNLGQCSRVASRAPSTVESWTVQSCSICGIFSN